MEKIARATLVIRLLSIESMLWGDEQKRNEFQDTQQYWFDGDLFLGEAISFSLEEIIRVNPLNLRIGSPKKVLEEFNSYDDLTETIHVIDLGNLDDIDQIRKELGKVGLNPDVEIVETRSGQFPVWLPDKRNYRIINKLADDHRQEWAGDDLRLNFGNSGSPEGKRSETLQCDVGDNVEIGHINNGAKYEVKGTIAMLISSPNYLYIEDTVACNEEELKEVIEEADFEQPAMFLEGEKDFLEPGEYALVRLPPKSIKFVK